VDARLDEGDEQERDAVIAHTRFLASACGGRRRPT
jgi:hypothetical protein